MAPVVAGPRCSGPGIGRPGRVRCRLSPYCLDKLAVYLEQGPAADGWVEGQVWTASRVAALIGRKFHVTYSVSGATRLMHRLGFSPQVPAQRIAERDEQAVTVWREATWAEAKERGRLAGATSAPRTDLGPARHHPGRDGQRTTLGTPVGRRTDRDAAGFPDPTLSPLAHPPRRQGNTSQYG